MDGQEIKPPNKVQPEDEIEVDDMRFASNQKLITPMKGKETETPETTSKKTADKEEEKDEETLKKEKEEEEEKKRVISAKASELLYFYFRSNCCMIFLGLFF